jgi:hypothetical protein
MAARGQNTKTFAGTTGHNCHFAHSTRLMQRLLDIGPFVPHHVEMSGSQPAAAAEVWSTSVVDPPRAFEYWRDLICDTFVQVNAACTRPGDFTGQITHAEVGGLEISTVRAGGHRVRRTSQLIARAGEQYLLACIQTRGRGRVEQDGRVAVLDPGAMALCDSTRPYTLHSDDAFEHVVVQVPLVDILAESGLRDAGQTSQGLRCQAARGWVCSTSLGQAVASR